jgi:gamma-glutamyl hydrolase
MCSRQCNPITGQVFMQNHSILERFDAEHRPAPLLFIGDWVKNHSIFQWVPQEVVDKLSEQSLAMENHQMGISPERWFSNKLLTDFFQVLTLTPDHNGKMYISTVMSPKYPVFGVQWHPEKNLFEWGDATIPHTADAVQLTQGISNYLIRCLAIDPPPSV